MLLIQLGSPVRSKHLALETTHTELFFSALYADENTCLSESRAGVPLPPTPSPSFRRRHSENSFFPLHLPAHANGDG
ncbi:hypothetical protein CDAR_264031 [Caerostris darwini]|uniref:Uncharacterized protein n=1 Tax=Caerostris darwini TaxID=1538125 RepID=A0AAV4TRM8_9ARAC|nr:hypothetical protein CDAR_264031 [Caerostris darwini]